MPDELGEADSWLYETLSDRAGLPALLPGGIHAAEVVPQGTALPYLRFQFQGGTAHNTMDGYRYMDRLLFYVAAVVPLGTGNPLARASAIQIEVDAAIRGRKGTQMPSGATVHGAVSRQPVRYNEPPERPVYLHYGRLYEIQVSGGGG